CGDNPTKITREMSESVTDFLLRLRTFVENEAKAQRETLNKQWNTPLNERVARGWAVEGLTVQQFRHNIIRLTCDTNESRFREGDLVILHRGDPYDKNNLHCDIQLDNETEIELNL